jgi:hypothetical protein
MIEESQSHKSQSSPALSIIACVRGCSGNTGGILRAIPTSAASSNSSLPGWSTFDGPVQRDEGEALLQRDEGEALLQRDGGEPRLRPERERDLQLGGDERGGDSRVDVALGISGVLRGCHGSVINRDTRLEAPS